MSPTTKKGAARPPKAKNLTPPKTPDQVAEEVWSEIPPPRLPAKPPAPKPKRGQPVGKTVELLPVKLDDAQLLERIGRLAQVDEQLDQHRLETKAIKKNRKETESHLSAISTALLTTLKTKEEEQPVGVESYALPFNPGLVEVVRTDTGEVVRTRPATEEEAQAPLFGDGGVA